MMTPASAYRFAPVRPDDLVRVNDWLQRPHVRAWWDADPMESADLSDARVARHLVSLGGKPFAYIQDYTVHGWPDHHFADLPAGARGIDQYIADPDMLGKGHGPAFIAAWIDVLFAAGAPVVATDPHPDNTRAIAAYRKAGFVPFGPPQESAWGPILPMRVDR